MKLFVLIRKFVVVRTLGGGGGEVLRRERNGGGEDGIGMKRTEGRTKRLGYERKK